MYCLFLKNEVARAIELREIVTSLGPAYIKLGQALSIRPDILSPSAMTELQKLCDKVPSFPDDVAMDLIKEELGGPWQEIYSELSPSPIAAGKTHFILMLLGNFHACPYKTPQCCAQSCQSWTIVLNRIVGKCTHSWPLYVPLKMFQKIILLPDRFFFIY